MTGKIIAHTLLNDSRVMGEVSRMKKTETVVDAGSGVRPFEPWRARHICIEPHDEYVRVLKRKGYEVIHSPAIEAIDRVPKETLFCLDVIEHMEKEDGLEFLDKTRDFEQALFFTPWGFMPQHQEEGNKDPWGYNGWEWQTHRSEWWPEDFERFGFRVKAIRQFHKGIGALLCCRW